MEKKCSNFASANGKQRMPAESSEAFARERKD